MSPTEALHHLADSLTTTVDSNLTLLMADDSAEPVHKARVALRRFRTLLDAFAPILDDDLCDALHDRARALFRVLGTIRDADVMAARFQGTDRAAKSTAHAAQQRHKGRKALKRKKAAGFRDWVQKRLSGKSWRQTGKKARALRDGPVTTLAALALDRAWAEALSNGPDLLHMSARAQHDLRKDLKALRYLSEFFEGLWPEAPSDLFLADLRAMQDDLGEVSDSETARALGHDDTTDTQGPQSRAATAWASLVARGPWWQADAADA
jgi:CHAD domain-containing protein